MNAMNIISIIKRKVVTDNRLEEKQRRTEFKLNPWWKWLKLSKVYEEKYGIKDWKKVNLDLFFCVPGAD